MDGFQSESVGVGTQPENTEQPVQNNAEIQTDHIEELPDQVPANTQNSAEPQPEEEEEKKYVSDESEESEDEATTNAEPQVYNSIRERYAKQVQKEKRREERRLRRERRENGDREVPTQESPNRREQRTGEAQTENVSPEDELRNVQGIVQLLSSKLLCQILSAGDLFQTHITEKIEEEVEMMRNKYSSIWYENILKARIFLADRHEHVERALQKIGLIPKDEEEPNELEENTDAFDIEEIDLDELETKLNDTEIVKTIYKYILEDDENYEI